MLARSCTSATVITIDLIPNQLNRIVCTREMYDVFSCDESGVLVTKSIIEKRKMYVVYRFNAVGTMWF